MWQIWGEGTSLTPFTTLTLEGEEVELVAEGHLAVRADGVEIGDGHFAVGGFLFGRGGVT